MIKRIINENSDVLERELNWLSGLIEQRFERYFGSDQVQGSVSGNLTPPTADKESGLGKLITAYNLSATERMVLILSLAPSLKPQLLDTFFTRNKMYDRGFTEFGGITGEQHGGFLPTGDTAVFIAGGESVCSRLRLTKIFSQDHLFYKHDIVRLQPSKGDEPLLSGSLVPGPDLLQTVSFNKTPVPEYNHKFPAKKLKTTRDWEDLVLPESVLEELDEITAWLTHKSKLMQEWGLSRILKPGFRSLFYGPPGTGKTMAAGLIGKRSGCDVLRVDLSQIVSKYIGETEKNLSRIFDRAEHQKWILFFDEADALFGQRTQTKSSNDRYSNQEVSYLLQRIEDFDGVILLATNLKDNIDAAFTRRFQSMIHFPLPDQKRREKLWTNILNGHIAGSEDICISDISEKYELAGGSMINALRYGALKAVRRKNGDSKLTGADLIEGIKRELKKQGKSLI